MSILRFGRWLLLLVVLLSTPVYARLVVVASVDSPVQKLSRQEIVNIYMGRFNQVNNIRISPVDLAMSSEERVLFYRLLVDKTLAEVNAYWSRLVFSGKTEPPIQAQNVAQLIRMLRENKNAIGYLDTTQLHTGLRIIYEFTADNP